VRTALLAFTIAALVTGCGADEAGTRVLGDAFLSPGPAIERAQAEVVSTSDELAQAWTRLGGTGDPPRAVPAGSVVAVLWAGRANGSAEVVGAEWDGDRLKLTVEVPPREGCMFPAVVGGALAAVAIERPDADRGPVNRTAVVEERERDEC
jgi:hypothetical protein